MSKFLTRRLMLGGAAAALAASSVTFAAEPNPLAEAMAGTAVPGMAAIVIRNFSAEGEVVAGVRRMGTTNAVERGDRWHLGSDGKAMTATMIACLAEQGVLAWDAPLERLLPELAASMHPDYRDVTLPDLLSHRSGLPENHSSFDFIVTFVDDPAPLPQQRLRLIAAALSEPPVVAKRTTHSYSNTGYLVAAAVAERATGRDYATLMHANIFRPLHMRSVTYDALGGPDEVIGHVDGRVADQRLDPNPRVYAPSDGLRLSLRDWSRFCIDQMRGEHGIGRLLRNETYRFLHARQGDTAYALGWFQQPTVFGRLGPAIFHSGSNGNWMAQALLIPRFGDAVLVVANSAYRMDGNTVSEAVLRQVGQTLSEAVNA